MIKALIHQIKHPPGPVRDVVKAIVTRFGPPGRRLARRARRAIRGPIGLGRLGAFLAGGRLTLPRVERPDLAVVVVVEGQPARLLACLRALAADRPDGAEVVLVDNGASAGSRRLLGRVEGAAVVRLDRRRPRAEAERRGVAQARGEFVAVLDADGRLAPGSLAAALETIRTTPAVGAVVGKTVGRDGRLEEAGSILWQDGSSEPYGAGRAPDDPEFLFRRAVDFGAGAFLLTRRSAADLPTDDDAGALGRILISDRLRAAGLATVYDPRVVLDRAGPVPRAARPDPAVVAARVGDRLGGQLPRSEQNILVARQRGGGQHRVLHIEPRVPHTTLGAGYPRSNSIVAELVKLGYFVTFYPSERLFRPERWAEVYRSVDRSVEVMIDHSEADLGRFLAGRAEFYDTILISRPPSMAAAKPFLPRDRPGGRPRIVYDAEALFSNRQIEQSRHEGKELAPAEQHALIAAEVALVQAADAVLAVSDGDARSFAAHGVGEIAILGHCVDPVPTPAGFAARSGFLFVGPVLFYASPNANSIEWFAAEIFPAIRARLGPGIAFRSAGTNHATELFPLEGDGVEFLGRVADLTALYDAARVFVAPTRFAAGIPLKCVEAAAHGVPIVATSLLARQLGWQAEEEILVADSAAAFAEQCIRLHQDPDLWGRIRAGGLRRVESTYSIRAFAETLRRTVGPQPPEGDKPALPAESMRPVGS